MERFEQLKDFILERKAVAIGVVIILLISGGGSYFLYQVFNDSKTVPISSQIVAKNEVEEEIAVTDSLEECLVVVDIKGEITTPGTYQVDCESRVQDVIDLAGGVTSKADTSVLNLGKKVFDEMVIIIYSNSETKNFTATKQEEKKKEEECIQKEEVRNDACVTEEKVVSSNSSDVNTTTDSSTSSNTNSSTNSSVSTPVNKLVSINTASKEELITLSGIGESKAQKIIDYRNSNGPFKTLEELKNVKGIGDAIFAKIKDSITL